MKGLAAFAVGSLGRREASDQSDLDFAAVFDPSEQLDPKTLLLRMMQSLKDSGFDVSQKTFGDPLSIDSLTKDVGGENDTNRSLTYRALILTEGVWLLNPPLAKTFRDRIFGAYREATITRGRYLTSLSNDLHRYYRTLCVDYRFKIEEGHKSWAIRNLKLRHSRKLWHLGNLALQCTATDLPADDHDAFIGDNLALPPLVKVANAMLAADKPLAVHGVFAKYERYLSELGSAETRAKLAEVVYDKQDASECFVGLRENADAFNEATIKVIDVLLAKWGTYLKRFAIL
jgi:hypothetical protein